MSAPLLSDYIKENTRQFHDAVESKFESQKIFDKSYTLNNYRQILWFNYLFHLNFEDKVFEKIDDHTAREIQLEERRKLYLLELDLKSLDMESAEPNHEFSVASEAEAFGILYVMEGSSLGGNVIKKHLLQNPEFSGLDFHYFGCYGEKTGELWNNFKEILNNKFTESQFPEVLAGATKAYRFLMNI